MVEEKDVRISSEIISFIEKELKRGVSEEVVKKKLLGVGHKESVINKHLTYVRHSKKTKTYVVIASVVFVLLVIYFFNGYTTDSPPVAVPMVDNVSEVPQVPVVQTPITPPIREPYKNADVFCENYTLLEKTGCELEVTHDNQLTNERLDKLSIIDAIRSSDVKSCESLSGYSMDACIDATKIMNILNLDECEALTTQYMEEYCKSNLYFELVGKIKDTTYCDKILVPIGMSNTCKEVFS